MTIVRRVGVLSLGKMMGCVYGLLGLIVGGLFSLFSVLGGMAASRGGGGGGAMIFGAAAVVMIPLLYGALGFIGGIIVGAIYNVVASVAGGIELELEMPARAGAFPVTGVMPR